MTGTEPPHLYIRTITAAASQQLTCFTNDYFKRINLCNMTFPKSIHILLFINTPEHQLTKRFISSREKSNANVKSPFWRMLWQPLLPFQIKGNKFLLPKNLPNFCQIACTCKINLQQRTSLHPAIRSFVSLFPQVAPLKQSGEKERDWITTTAQYKPRPCSLSEI